MNTLKTMLLFTLPLGIFPMQAQNNNIIKFGATLLGLEDGDREGDNGAYPGGGFSLEHQLAPKTSLSLNVSWNARKAVYHGGRLNTWNLLYSKTTIEPEFRFYPIAATKGFYIGGAVALHLLRARRTATDLPVGTYVQFGTGLTTGYQFRLTQALHLQLGGGIGVFMPKNNVNDSYLAYDGLDASYRYHLNLLLGYKL